MDTSNAINLFIGINWLDIIIQIVAVVMSIGYLGYALVYQQQLGKMARNALIYEHLLNDPVQTQKPAKTILYSLSLLQLLLGAMLLIMSLFFLNLA